MSKYASFSQYLDLYKKKQQLSPKDYKFLMSYSHYDFYNITPVPVRTKIDNLLDAASMYDIWQKENEIIVKAPPIIEKTKMSIEIAVNSIADLISIIDKYPICENTEYNIDLIMLHKISTELRKLDSMIGLTLFKKKILDQILYFLQGLSGPGDYKHMVIYGSPGTGKTDIAKILGTMYAKMGILAKPAIKKAICALDKPISTVDSCVGEIFKKATRSDLVAGYLGQTSIKTKALITECLGGVLFIDEIYSLGDDAFSKECADTLCEALSDNKDGLIVIIAGYETEVNERFFKLNMGLESRFAWRFTIDDYTSTELWKIFKKKIADCSWTHDILDTSGEDWFKRKYKDFPGFGRDIETLLFKVKISYSRRIYGKQHDDVRKMISITDLDSGFLSFKECMKKSATYGENKHISSMFL